MTKTSEIMRDPALSGTRAGHACDPAARSPRDVPTLNRWIFGLFFGLQRGIDGNKQET